MSPLRYFALLYALAAKVEAYLASLAGEPGKLRSITRRKFRSASVALESSDSDVAIAVCPTPSLLRMVDRPLTYATHCSSADVANSCH